MPPFVGKGSTFLWVYLEAMANMESNSTFETCGAGSKPRGSGLADHEGFSGGLSCLIGLEERSIVGYGLNCYNIYLFLL